MATHSSVLAWSIPRTEEPGRLLFMRLQRVSNDQWLTLFPWGAVVTTTVLIKNLSIASKNPVCLSSALSLPTPPALASPGEISVPVLLLHPDCPMNGILQPSVTFCVWLLWFSVILLRFIHVIECVISLLLSWPFILLYGRICTQGFMWTFVHFWE